MGRRLSIASIDFFLICSVSYAVLQPAYLVKLGQVLLNLPQAHTWAQAHENKIFDISSLINSLERNYTALFIL
jgi:hypothetical protein